MADVETANRRRLARQAQRATTWRNNGGLAAQQDRSRANQHSNQQRKSQGLLFYNDMLRDDPDLRMACIDRDIFNETFNKWKKEKGVSCHPSEALGYLKKLNLICKEANNSTATTIAWTADVDGIVLSFYDAKLRNNPRLRRSCTNRRVLTDTINEWKIEQRLENDLPSQKISISPTLFKSILMKLGLIMNPRDISTRNEIIWSAGIEGIVPLTAEERADTIPFDQNQVRANRAGLAFYNQKLRDNRVLRRSCAYRNILNDVMNQWLKSPSNEGDPPKEGVKCAALIFGLKHRWGLIDHINTEQGIVAWKEDVLCYNDGVITWKNRSYTDGKREWVSDEEYKRRVEKARNEYAAIVALSFYRLKMRDNAQLRQACTYRNFLNDTIDAWKLEPVEVGDPPRYTSRLSIIFQLHKQWGLIKSFTSEMIVWKEDMISGNESEQLRSYDDMLEALYA